MIGNVRRIAIKRKAQDISQTLLATGNCAKTRRGRGELKRKKKKTRRGQCREWIGYKSIFGLEKTKRHLKCDENQRINFIKPEICAPLSYTYDCRRLTSPLISSIIRHFALTDRSTSSKTIGRVKIRINIILYLYVITVYWCGNGMAFADEGRGSNQVAVTQGYRCVLPIIHC